MITKLKDYNFHYIHGCEYDYENYYDCHNGSDCCDNDYCRCGVIENARVTDVPKNFVADLFNGLSVFDHYCIDRILACHKVWDTRSYEVRVCGGYYGQEIDGVYFENGFKADNDINALLIQSSDAKKLEFILKLEYGYVLDELEGKTPVIKEILKDRLKFGQQDHLKKLDRDAVDYYKDYELPRGLVVHYGPLYKVIDGYHRISACNEEITKVVVCE